MEKMVEIKSVSVSQRKDSFARPRVYFFVDEEDAIENLINRWSRPYNQYRKVLPAVFTKAGYPCLSQFTSSWSQTAGCACGCSPGFIIKGPVPRELYGLEIFVTVLANGRCTK